MVIGTAFIPIGALGAGLSLSDAVVFAVGLLVGNVPEGLLPVITLALAVGVRGLVRQGAVVKRLSAVETLGCTDVISTDKTGTLTENQMRVSTIWTAAQIVDLGVAVDARSQVPVTAHALSALAQTMAACNSAQADRSDERTADERTVGDPTEVAILAAAARLGADVSSHTRNRHRQRQFHFDPALKLMSTIDIGDAALWVHTKGAPEEVLPRCTTIVWRDDRERPLGDSERAQVERSVDRYAREGLRVLAVARRRLTTGTPTNVPREREQMA